MIYFLSILIWNCITFVLMGIDKWRAIYNKRRISERKLLLSGLLFGGAGSFFGMKFFHHKTKKGRFETMFSVSAIYTVAFAAWLFGSFVL